MVQGSHKFVKYLLFFFNLLFVITGIAVISVGAVIQAKAKNYYNFVDDKFTSTAVLLIVVGVIIFLIAFFGCCGAIKENRCMVLTFSVLLFIIFVLEISAGGAAYAYRNQLKDGLTKGMEENFQKYVTDNATRTTWDDMQKNMHCCGVKNASDYDTVTGGVPPTSCCAKYNNGTSVCEEEFPQGCATVLFNDLEKYQYTIGGVGIGIAFVQLVGIVFACCLASAIKKQYEVV